MFDYEQLLAKYIIADDVRAKAYEGSSSAQRACLKNAIALHSIAGESPNFEQVKRSYTAKGYALDIQKQCVPWVLCICASGYAAPARLIAALMPALLAQVPKIFVGHLGDDTHTSILLALELLGLDDAFALPSEQSSYEIIENFVISLYNQMGQGRILLLGADNITPVQDKIKQLQVPIWIELPPPHIYKNLTEQQGELLHWAQSDAIFCQHLHDCNASYGIISEEHNSNKTAQMWAQNMEACFIHPQLGGDFFQNTSFMAKLLRDEDE